MSSIEEPTGLPADEQRTSAVVGTGVWMISAAAILAAGLVLHALFPRYEFAAHGMSGEAVVVFDRWTGRFQRATYGPDGEPRASSVVRPF